jgi:hypothetical protein
MMACDQPAHKSNEVISIQQLPTVSLDRQLPGAVSTVHWISHFTSKTSRQGFKKLEVQLDRYDTTVAPNKYGEFSPTINNSSE